MTTKEVDKFCALIVRLDPIEFVGLARLLCVDITKDDEPIDSAIVITNMLAALELISPRLRKKIFKVMSTAGDKNETKH